MLIADSWFGSVPCIIALFTVGLFAVMMVKTAHKDYPKQKLLDLLGYDATKKLCPKERRGEHFGFSRDYTMNDGHSKCTVLAAAHNSKKPVLLIATASTLTPAKDYKKTWKILDGAGQLVTYTVQVATTMVHALYHGFFHLVDVHNHLRQGQTSMADVWDTKDWGDRHFAEGLGFWEVNVFKALVYFHPDYKKLTHPRFRRLLAHAMLTLGKVPFGEAEPEPEARPAHSCCTLKRFTSYTNEKHQCGYCQQKSYFYCATCFPEEKKAEYAICNPCSSDKPCFHRHIIGEKPTHKMQHIKKKKKAAEPTRASPRRASQARTGPGADPGVGGARRRIDPDA